MRILRRSATAVLVMAVVLVLASGCRLVGSGTLGSLPNAHVYYAVHGSAVTVEVFRPAPGDAWPPAGQLGLRLRAENIPDIGCWRAPWFEDCSDSWRSTVYLARLRLSSEPTSPDYNWEYPSSCDPYQNPDLPLPLVRAKEYRGPLVVTPDGFLDAFLTIDDTPDNWQASWVLTTAALPVYPGLPTDPSAHRIVLRCGTITVAPP